MSLDGAQLDEILEAARSVADDAGALLLDGLGRPKRVAHKGAVDLVTDFDRRAEELIVRGLERRFPAFGALAEEGAAAETADRETIWIIDPLDGTTNFSHGHPAFAVSIGLEHRGRLVAGVIAMPGLGDAVWARRGGGARCARGPVRVSSAEALDRALVATGFPYDRREVEDDNTREHRAVLKRAQGVRRCGAAAVDLALVARGVYDAFWEPRLHAWDLAAGVVVVEEAGGRTSGYDGEPVDVRRGWIAASNGLVHEELLAVLAGVRGG